MVALAPNTSETSTWDVLDTFPKLHSRAREAFTARCTEAPHSKSRNGIEIWQVVYESRIGLESFTRDPIGYIGGGNLFEFVDSHPLVGIDPTGLFFELPSSFEGSDDPTLTPIEFPRWWEDGPKNLTECFDKCIEDNPKAVRNDGESDRAFSRRKDARDALLENCNLQCMKKHPPTGCKPFKDLKKGEPKKDKNGCWVDDSGRKWCPESPGGEKPHWDVQPPIGKLDDVWETPCCKCHTKKGERWRCLHPMFPQECR